MDPNKYFNIKEEESIVKKYEDYMSGKEVAGNNIKVGICLDTLKVQKYIGGISETVDL